MKPKTITGRGMGKGYGEGVWGRGMRTQYMIKGGATNLKVGGGGGGWGLRGRHCIEQRLAKH